jgi:hypothetical protein
MNGLRFFKISTEFQANKKARRGADPLAGDMGQSFDQEAARFFRHSGCRVGRTLQMIVRDIRQSVILGNKQKNNRSTRQKQGNFQYLFGEVTNRQSNNEWCANISQQKG